MAQNIFKYTCIYFIFFGQMETKSQHRALGCFYIQADSLHALNQCSIGSVEVRFFHWRPYRLHGSLILSTKGLQGLL